MHEPRILGHSIHPIIIVSPLCLLSLSVVFDFIHLVAGAPSFAVISYWMMATGLIGGFITNLLGWIDWMAMTDQPKSRGLGLAYGLVNTAVLLFYTGSWYARYNDAVTPEVLATVFSTVGAGVALVGSWLGGELFKRAPIDNASREDALISLNVTTIDTHNATVRGAH